MENYFNYFTEIEDYFQRRRGTVLLLSTLDWALIETWKDAGVPLAAVLRGIDASFERYERRPSKTRKVNSLAYCAQEVLAEAEEMKEAAVGMASPEKKKDSHLDAEEIAAYLRRNADRLEKAGVPAAARGLAQDSARTLRELADRPIEQIRASLEDLERRLSVMEEKLFAVLLGAMPDEELVAIRAQAEREIAPYRSKMSGPQLEQLHKQYVHKVLLEKHGVPRLSLFYM